MTARLIAAGPNTCAMTGCVQPNTTTYTFRHGGGAEFGAIVAVVLLIVVYAFAASTRIRLLESRLRDLGAE